MYRLLFSALFVLAIAVPAALAQDPTKVDAKHYKVEFQNSRVRIVRAHYGPHEKSVMRNHPDLVAIFQTDGRVKFTYPNGTTEDLDIKWRQEQFIPPLRPFPHNFTTKHLHV